MKNRYWILLICLPFALNAQRSDCVNAKKSYFKKLNKISKETDYEKKKIKLEKLSEKFNDLPNAYFMLAEMYQAESNDFMQNNNYETATKLQSKANSYFIETIAACPSFHA